MPMVPEEKKSFTIFTVEFNKWELLKIVFFQHIIHRQIPQPIEMVLYTQCEITTAMIYNIMGLPDFHHNYKNIICRSFKTLKLLSFS
jgi:hypothetical protein